MKSDLVPATTSSPKSNWNTRRIYIFFAIGLTILSCLLNIGGLGFEEVIDDHDLIHNYKERGCGKKPLDCFKGTQFGLYYRPLLGMSFSIGENLHGLNHTRAFKIENLLMHAVVVVLGCWVFWLMFRKLPGAMIASGLFALHPLQIPATTFIGGRTDTIALFFLFVMLIGVMQASYSQMVWFWRGVALFGYLALLFAKEQGLLMPLLMPLFASLHKSEGGFRRFTWMLLFFLLPPIYFAAAKNAIPEGAIDTVGWVPDEKTVAWDLGMRLEMIGRTLWFYVRAFFTPIPEVLHTSTVGPWSIRQPLTITGGYLAVIGWGVCLFFWRKNRQAFASLLLLGALMLPVINIIPIPSQFVACYRAPLPLVGVVGFFAALLGAARKMKESEILYKTRLFVIPIFLGVVFCGLSLADVPHWQSDLSVVNIEYKGDPNFLPALAGRAGIYQAKGKYAEALEDYNRVIDILYPNIHTAEERVAMLNTYSFMWHTKSLSSLRYTPHLLVNRTFRGRGGTYHLTGRYAEALEDYKIAIKADSKDDEVLDAIGTCLIELRRFRELIQTLEPVVKTRPTAYRYFRLGQAYTFTGKYVEAQTALRQAQTMTSADKQTALRQINSLLEQVNAIVEATKKNGR